MSCSFLQLVSNAILLAVLQRNIFLISSSFLAPMEYDLELGNKTVLAHLKAISLAVLQSIIHNLLGLQLLLAPHDTGCSHYNPWLAILHSRCQRLRWEPSKYHRVHCSNASTRQHGDWQFTCSNQPVKHSSKLYHGHYYAFLSSALQIAVLSIWDYRLFLPYFGKSRTLLL